MNFEKLYKLAFEYKRTKLWTKLYDTQLFAVKLSDDRIGYISIMGAAGEVFSLALYIGSDGYNSLRGIMEDSPYIAFEDELREIIISQNCLQCSLESKDDMDENDLKQARAYAKKLGERLAGAHAYPCFTKYTPYCTPWNLETEQDIDDLCRALEAAIEISKMLESKSAAQIGLKDVGSKTKKIILLEKTEDGFTVGKTDIPAKVKKVTKPKCENEIALKRLLDLPAELSLELEVFRLWEPVKNDEISAPSYPIVLIARNIDENYLINVTPVVHYEENPDELMNNFINAVVETGSGLKELHCFDDRTHDFLRPLADKLDIELFFDEDASDELIDVMTSLGGEDIFDYDDDDEDFDFEEVFFDEKDSGFADVKADFVNKVFQSLVQNAMEEGKLSQEELAELLESLGVNLPIDITDYAMGEEQSKLNSGSDDDVKLHGSYVISVSLMTGCYRHIRISADCTLFDLHRQILEAFGFDDDHLHAFFMNNKLWSNRDCYYDERDSSSRITTSEVKLGRLGLFKDKKFKYLFDFGDSWEFQCKVLKVLDEDTDAPKIIKSVGEAPNQYPNYDEDEGDFDGGFFPL